MTFAKDNYVNELVMVDLVRARRATHKNRVLEKEKVDSL